jgi:serine/threonine protein kinase
MSWSEIGTTFDALLEKSETERVAEIERLSLRDPRFADEVASLLEAHFAAEDSFESKLDGMFEGLAHGFEILETPPALSIGEMILHFEILELLGEGSLAKVYLAKDTELGRLVAMKVTRNRTAEARTLANFSADGIVQVHSEHALERDGQSLRLICLQFIAGPTLAEIAEGFERQPSRNLIELIEARSSNNTTLEPGALKWRETLSRSAMPEAIVLIGMKLARSLDHAHRHGILHLDIKPANVLLDQYGRPYLTDFNVSASVERLKAGDHRGLGGTPRYMAPEQADVFSGRGVSLDARADIFSLGVVLRDLMTLLRFNDERLELVLARAANPDRESRFTSAGDFALNLAKWLRWRMAEREMPRLLNSFRWIETSPVAALAILGVCSQLVASIINIAYNQLQIVSALSAEQNQVFMNCVAAYNAITYPISILFFFLVLKPAFKAKVPTESARRSALLAPLCLVIFVTIGWLPGGWIFPYAIDRFAGPVDASIYWQFMGSFTLAWMASLTTSLAVSLLVLSRGLYPKFWPGCAETAAKELRVYEGMNRSLTFIAALVPMSGALIVILLAPIDLTETTYRSLKILLLMIVGFGLGNLMLIHRLTRLSGASFAALRRSRSL